MRGPPNIAIGFAAASIGAVAIYGWGLGWFDPCGPVDDVLRASACRVVARVKEESVDVLLAQGDASVLAVVSQTGPMPTQAPRLLNLALSAGDVLDAVDLAMPADAAPFEGAISGDGARLVLSCLDAPVQVLDRATGAVISEIGLTGAPSLAFSTPDRVIVEWDGTDPSRPPMLAARTFDATTGRPLPDATGAKTLPLFTQGVGRALSPDGTLLARHVPTRGESGTVAIRMTDAAAPADPGRTLTAPLGVGRFSSGHVLPRLWFAPDGTHLAASFDSADRWGVQTSALLIWDVATGDLVRRVPTRMSHWDKLV